MAAPALDDVVEELYGLPRDDFIPRRDELAKQARDAGDRAAAGEIAKLRKPSVAAWMANALAREHPDEVGALEELGGSLRDAQERLEGEALRRLSRQRRELMAALVERGRRIAREDGVRVGDAVVRELERTVTAALSDPDAARALAAGRLVTALEPGAGLGAASAASASTSRTPARPGRTRRASSRPASSGRVDGAVEGAAGADEGVVDEQEAAEAREAAQAREAAERERRVAERDRARDEVGVAEAAVEQASTHATRAAERAGQAESDVVELRERLTAAEAELRRARDDAAEADRVRTARERDADDARDRLRRTEQALAEL